MAKASPTIPDTRNTGQTLYPGNNCSRSFYRLFIKKIGKTTYNHKNDGKDILNHGKDIWDLLKKPRSG